MLKLKDLSSENIPLVEIRYLFKGQMNSGFLPTHTRPIESTSTPPLNNALYRSLPLPTTLVLLFEANFQRIPTQKILCMTTPHTGDKVNVYLH